MYLEIKDFHVQFHTSDHEAVRGHRPLRCRTVKLWGWWAKAARARP